MLNFFFLYGSNLIEMFHYLYVMGAPLSGLWLLKSVIPFKIPGPKNFSCCTWFWIFRSIEARCPPTSVILTIFFLHITKILFYIVPISRKPNFETWQTHSFNKATPSQFHKWSLFQYWLDKSVPIKKPSNCSTLGTFKYFAYHIRFHFPFFLK